MNSSGTSCARHVASKRKLVRVSYSQDCRHTVLKIFECFCTTFTIFCWPCAQRVFRAVGIISAVFYSWAVAAFFYDAIFLSWSFCVCERRALFFARKSSRFVEILLIHDQNYRNWTRSKAAKISQSVYLARISSERRRASRYIRNHTLTHIRSEARARTRPRRKRRIFTKFICNSARNSRLTHLQNLQFPQ